MAFAPGKVILLGEHAVVYGQPALAGALGQGVVAHAVPGEGWLRVPTLDVTLARTDDDPLAQAYHALLGSLGLSALPFDLVVEFQLPTSSGLGSSAALAVALCRALDERLGLSLSRSATLDAAMAAETVFHGKPSGIDAAVAVHGGFGRFTRQTGFATVSAARPVPLCIGHTGRKRDTKGRVARVAELQAERPAEMQAHFAAVGALVAQGIAAVEAGDFAALGAAMNENARHLDVMEVSCPEIARMCAIAHAAGALGAKLTGGGGGGCVIALAPGREQAVLSAWREGGFTTSFVTEVGGR